LDFSGVVEEIDEEVQEERRFAIDAALVRLMKSSKTMKQTMLIQESCKQLSMLFQAHPPFVRKRMEDLIDREFMKRDEENPGLLHYVA
jgi:hypothetical protein